MPDRAAGVTTQAIIDDADLKRRRLDQYLGGLEAEISRQSAPHEAEVARLQEEIRRLEVQLEETRARLAEPHRFLATAQRACAAHSAALRDVARLLAEPLNPAVPPAEPEPEDHEDFPPLPYREESLRRLLGLTADAA